MSELISAPLDVDQLTTAKDSDRPIELSVFAYWADHGFPVEAINEAYSVINRKVDGENTAHVVLNVDTLSKPINRADVAVDQMTKWCCDCRDYQYNRGVDLTERTLTEWEPCKHIQACSKAAKAKADDNQQTL
jgi:hypothetical protein